MIGILRERGDIAYLLVEGHASYEGSVDYNWELSTRRAAAVFRYLVEQGINARRVSYRGMGEAVPRAGGVAEESLAENRRVDFRILHWIDTRKESIPDWDRNKPPIPWLMDEPEAGGGAPEVPEIDIDQPEDDSAEDQRR